VPILHGYNLSKFIETSPPPQTTISSDGSFSINPEFLSWHRQDQLLLSWIRSSLTELVQAQVCSCVTTADLWSTLSNIFLSSSRARLIELRRKLHTSTKGSMSCSDFLQQIRKLTDELAFIGSPISDEDLVLFVLNGLGHEFNSFVVAVIIAATSRTDSLHFADIHRLLLSHEALLTAQTPPSSPFLILSFSLLY
jgi:gag-polypeptide of LTR copia-type